MKHIGTSLKKQLEDSCGPTTPGYALCVSKAAHEFSLVGGLRSLECEYPITIHSTFDAGSIAKTLTGLSIALLEDQGMLSLDQSVRYFVPELPAFCNAVRLRHLLAHESGLHNYSPLLYYMSGWHPHAPPSTAEVLHTIARTPGLKRVPGMQYEYADTNYFLLSRIIERAANLSFGRFVEEHVFGPLGMGDSHCTDIVAARPEPAEGYVSYKVQLRSSFELRAEPQNQPYYPVGLRYRHVGAEGFRTSAHDLHLLGQELLSPTLFSPSTIRRMTAPNRIREDGLGYGYGLNVGEYLGQRFLGHDGQIEGFTASLSVFPDHDLIVACLTNRLDLGAWTCRLHVLKELLGVEPSQHQGTLHITGAGTAPNPGHYLNPETSSVLEIREVDDGLVANRDFGPVQLISYAHDPKAIEAGLGVLGASHQAVYFPFDRSQDSFDEYEGDYTCLELHTTFRICATATGVSLKNQDTRRPSMDLDYVLTIPDFFWSHDPYPGISQIQFLREGDSVTAFIYRDYDGDGREVFRFNRVYL